MVFFINSTEMFISAEDIEKMIVPDNKIGCKIIKSQD